MTTRLLTWLGLLRANSWERPTLLDRLFASPLDWLVTTIYPALLALRGRPFHPPAGRPPIRVVCISDTHDQTPPVPDGDVLIHAGDLTNAGTAADVQRALDWLASLPHPHKVLVCGNHDSWFDPSARRPEDRLPGAAVPDLGGIHYLEHTSVTLSVRGRALRVHGAPDIPACGGAHFAFQYAPASPTAASPGQHPWDRAVPPGTDVLVTHTPPAHHLDLGKGCRGLLAEAWRVRPRLHVFGHVHCAAGREPAYFDDCQRAYERVLDRPGRRGPLADLVPGPAWLDALLVLWYGVHSLLWKWIMAGPGSNQGSLMVNAGLMRGNTQRMGNKPQVVEL